MKTTFEETKTAPTLSAKELAQINKFTRKPVEEGAVYTFPVILCDNEVDRDFECFSAQTLHALAPLFVGKTGIFDHNPSAKNQTARIYDTAVVTDAEKKTTYGAPYVALTAKAYLMRTDQTKSLIEELDGGIKKEVSVGCSVAHIVCSICGVSHREGGCDHQPGQMYEGKQCFHRLEQPTDVYEWSFVAVPAQRSAGVTKQGDPQNMRQKRLSVEDDSERVLALKAEVQALKPLAEEAKTYQKALQQELITRCHLSGDLLLVKVLQSVGDGLSLTELTGLLKEHRTGGTLPQTKRQARDTEVEKNQSFKL